MRPETAVVDIQGQYRVYTEHHRADTAEKTIILVNGSLATTASFAQTVRYLHPTFNVVLYDQPYAGRSKPHNLHGAPLTKEHEAQVLLELIEHHRADHVLSFSWGGSAALLALAQHPQRIEKAVISSFSPVINAPMRDYLQRGITHLQACNRNEVGHLVNSTLGKYLPSLFKRFNHRHVSSLADHEYRQMSHHIDELLCSPHQGYGNAARTIEVPVLFVNGEWDEYTTSRDALGFADCIRHSHFQTIPGAGHFLDMENKSAREDTRGTLFGFLQSAPTPQCFGHDAQALWHAAAM